MKPLVLGLWAFLASPFRTAGAFVFRHFLVPAYHAIFLMRRWLQRIYLPARNRVLFLFSNRFAIHGAVIGIAIITISFNMQTKEVRAEEFGQESILSTLLSGDGGTIIQEVTAEETIVPVPVSYQDETTLSTTLARELDYESVLLGTDLIANTEGTALSVGSTGSETEASTAKRDEIETYVVQDGDTISTIADQFDISITTLLWANDLSVRSTIRPNDELSILPVDGILHTVKQNDTLSKIAAAYSVEGADISSFNKLADENDLVIGEVLLVPGGEKQAPAPARSVASVRNIFTPESSAPPAASNASPSAGGDMIWPTDLRLITTYYGQYYKFGRHYGLDIDCKFDNNNYAAADGIVTYSDWQSGYGYLVEIDHGNGLTTKYGHHARLYVSSGDSVSQGDPIGMCGTSGLSTGTHLHFEVLVNGKTVNPLNYIQ